MSSIYTFYAKLNRPRTLRLLALGGTVGLAVSAAAVGAISFETYRNTAGVHRTFSTLGPIQQQRLTSPFFLPHFVNGVTNGKTCEKCHFASNGWGLLVDHVNDVFNQTNGLDPLFTFDAADNPIVASNPANVDTLAKRQSVYSLMLGHALALVRITPPATSDYTMIGVNDNAIPGLAATATTLPDGTTGGNPSFYFAYTSQFNGGTPQFWFHRRPLPTTNFQFLTSVSWDGRSTPQADPSPTDIHAGVVKVSHDTLIQREGGAGQPDSILIPISNLQTNFQFSTTTAQIIDWNSPILVGGMLIPVGGGTLMSDGATNGPTNLAATPFFIGINDPFSPSFNKRIFNLYNQTWVNNAPNPSVKAARARILAGQEIFDTKQFMINDPGLVAQLGGNAQSIPATCGTCHNTPNVGNHSSKKAIALGVSDLVVNPDKTISPPAGLDSGAVPDLPQYVLQNNTTGEIVHVTDLGLGAVTGKWADIGKFKVALPRNLESRSPYFHNGAAVDLEHLVNFYDQRFSIGLTEDEKGELVSFLQSL